MTSCLWRVERLWSWTDLVDSEQGSTCQTSRQFWQATASADAHSGFHCTAATLRCRRCLSVGVVALGDGGQEEIEPWQSCQGGQRTRLTRHWVSVWASEIRGSLSQLQPADWNWQSGSEEERWMSVYRARLLCCFRASQIAAVILHRYALISRRLSVTAVWSLYSLLGGGTFWGCRSWWSRPIRLRRICLREDARRTLAPRSPTWRDEWREGGSVSHR